MRSIDFQDLKPERCEVVNAVHHWFGDIPDWWLAGGALRTLINTDEEPDDLDFFFRTEQAVKEIYGKLLRKGFEVVFMCPKKELTTLKRTDPISGKTLKIQLITKRYYTDVTDLLNSFDFNVCRCAFDGWNVYITKQFVRDVKTKRLTLWAIEYPVASIKRLIKYSNKGYVLNQEFLSSFVEEISMREFDGDKLALYID